MEESLQLILKQMAESAKQLELINKRIADLEMKSDKSPPFSSAFGSALTSLSLTDEHHGLESFVEQQGFKSGGHSVEHPEFTTPSPPTVRNNFDSASPLTNLRASRISEKTIVLQDPNIKLVPPSIECKDQAHIKPLEFLEYFENVASFMQVFQRRSSIKFEDSATFAVTNLKVPQQKQLAKLISVIYDSSDLEFVAEEDLGNVVWWHSVTTEMAKARLSAKLSLQTSMQSCVRDLMRVKFVSPFGLIDPDAWDDYRKKLSDRMSHYAKVGYKPPQSVVKDVIICALPDLNYQKDLFLLFGPIGSIHRDQSLASLVATIQARINSIMSLNLQAVVNKAVTTRDANFNQSKKFKVNFSQMLCEENGLDTHSDNESPKDDLITLDANFETEEDESQSQLLAFLAESAGQKTCDRCGVGPDGKLKCKFLGGPKAVCIFVHPKEDIALKGKGVTVSVPASHVKSKAPY
jgi:hypothetical protein